MTKPIYFLFIVATVIIRCGKKDGGTTSIGDSTFQTTETLQATKPSGMKEKEFDAALLQGIWWTEGNNVSAAFLIDGDSLYYTEELKAPFLVKIKGQTFLMARGNFDVVYKLKILTKDSLILFDETTGKTSTFFKKRELK